MKKLFFALFLVVTNYGFAQETAVEKKPLLRNNVLLPFVNRDNSQRNIAKAHTYLKLFETYKTRGLPEDYANMEAAAKKAVEFAELSGDSRTRAQAYIEYGSILSINGNVPLAHEYIYKSINLWESIKNFDEAFRVISKSCGATY